MSTLDNLSVAANVLQVVGFADTVFRAGKILYEVFDNARSASRNIALLLLELQALLSVVAFVRVVIIEHASSPFAQDDGHTLSNVHTILTLIEQDFRHLRGLLGQTVGSRREGWLSLLTSNVRWALKDCEIAASRDRLARYTQNLNAALSVSGRRNDIVLRTKLQNIEDRLHSISQSNPTRPLDTNLDRRPLCNRPAFRTQRRQTRAAYTRVQPRSTSQSSVVKLGCAPTRPNYPKDGVITPALEDIDKPHIPFVSYAFPKVNIYKQENQTLLLDTGNSALHQFTKPAMLLRDSLIASFETMSTKPISGINKVQVEYLQMLFDFLVASAHTASAMMIMGTYSNNTRTELLDPSFPANKYKNATIRKRGKGFSSIANKYMPTYVEEKTLKFDAIVGSARGKVLLARTYTDSVIVAFIFEYHGDVNLDLSPFAVGFTSHELGSYLRCGPHDAFGSCSCSHCLCPLCAKRHVCI